MPSICSGMPFAEPSSVAVVATEKQTGFWECFLKKSFIWVLSLGTLLSTAAIGYDCNSDCSGGGYSYPCPTFGNPGKTVHGDLPNDPACMSAKSASCDLWNGSVDFFAREARPFLEGTFTHTTWAAAEGNGKTDDYMTDCVAAAVSVSTVVGAKFGGVCGGLGSGAAGAFMSKRICEQSQTW